jgi:WbqC-like protein family
MGKKIAILQSNYIPWRGYFDIISRVDEFVLYDDMQYTRNDWRNRNQIKSESGMRWLSIPVNAKGRQAITTVTVSDYRWIKDHPRTILFCYRKAPYAKFYKEWLLDTWNQAHQFTRLSEINRHFLTAVCQVMGISHRFTLSSSYTLAEGKTERLIGICQQAQATEYICGPSSKNYLDETMFAAAGIKVTYMNYTSYPVHEQLHGPYDEHVSIIDLLLHTGPQARDYISPHPIQITSNQ